MKQLSFFKCATACIALFFFTTGCSESTTDKTSDRTSDTAQAMATKADPATLKEVIQELETAWATADNARDVNTLAAF